MSKQSSPKLDGAVSQQRKLVRPSRNGGVIIDEDLLKYWAMKFGLLKDIDDAYRKHSSHTEAQRLTIKMLRVLDAVIVSLPVPVRVRNLPVSKLIRALQDVVDGYEHPLFKPYRTGRPKESSRLRQIKGMSAAAMQVLMENGHTKLDAAKAVAKVLTEGGFRLTQGGKKATAKTVAAWRDRAIGHASDPMTEDASWAYNIIECKGRALAHLRTSDPKVKVERALSEVQWATRNLV